jgi:hypothetical protein
MNRHTTPHVRLENHGSLILVHPLTEAARTWLEEHTDGTWFGLALVVEPRYLADLLRGLKADLNPSMED